MRRLCLSIVAIAVMGCGSGNTDPTNKGGATVPMGGGGSSGATGEDCTPPGCTACVLQYCVSQAIAVFGAGYQSGDFAGAACPGLMACNCSGKGMKTCSQEIGASCAAAFQTYLGCVNAAPCGTACTGSGNSSGTVPVVSSSGVDGSVGVDGSGGATKKCGLPLDCLTCFKQSCDLQATDVFGSDYWTCNLAGGKCPNVIACSLSSDTRDSVEDCVQKSDAICVDAFGLLKGCVGSASCGTACTGNNTGDAGGNGGNASNAFGINISVTGSMDGHTNIQVCIDSAGNRFCGPEGGFGMGSAGVIQVIGNSGTSYSVDVSGQPASPHCSIVSGGAGTLGSSMPTVVVNCV
jgi:hypothetical protein